MASAASTAPPWVILGAVPRVLPAVVQSDLPPGAADFSLTLPAPPRVALLTVASRIFPCLTPTPDNFTFLLAVDPSAGLLLLHADHSRDAGPTFTDTPAHYFELEFPRRPLPGRYFVLDAAAGSALQLPMPGHLPRPGHLGLIASPEGEGYMVAELLEPYLGDDTANLRCFSSWNGEWVSKDVGYPIPDPERPLRPNGVISCSGRLWWVDLSWCLLTCDPFADAPVLTVVKLPEGKALESRSTEAWGLIDKYRCVGVSAGKLRFVDMYRNRNSNGAAQISVWTLADYPPYCTEWTLEYEATFAEICNDATYKATGLPRKIPVLALIHPTNPDVVYFFLDEHLLGVDVRARKVIGCEVYELLQHEDVAARFVHAWQLPRALRSGGCDAE